MKLLFLSLLLAFAAAQDLDHAKKEVVSRKVKNSMPPMTKRPRFIDQYSTGHVCTV